jgi:hypothetical protein
MAACRRKPRIAPYVPPSATLRLEHVSVRLNARGKACGAGPRGSNDIQLNMILLQKANHCPFAQIELHRR